jgi:AAA15 family ATPase/GTPase
MLGECAMLERLTIENFRRFQKLEFTRLKRVNLIAGKNNTGKTAVLEALLMLLDVNWTQELRTAFRNCQNIGDEAENYWKWLFHKRETSRAIIIAVETEELRDYTVAFGMQGTVIPPKF